MTVKNLTVIPQELRSLPQWVNWRWEQRMNPTTGELVWTKPPYQTNGQHAESDNPATWTTFEKALAAYESGKFDGIGFVVTDKDPFSGVDLDHCVNAETRAVEEWAMKIVRQLDSYTEISPSGTGLRIFIRAKLPPKDRKIGNFECYEWGRYLTTTGDHVPGTPFAIEQRQVEMDQVHTEVFAERNSRKTNSNSNGQSSHVTPILVDDDFLNKAFAAKNGNAIWRLFHGDITGYGSQSEADLALCSHLGFYTGPDPGKLDRLFRGSDLFRPKWDDQHGSSTYGAMTISKALDGGREFYSNGHGANDYEPSFAAPSKAVAKWPEPMAEEAFQGIAGHVVRAIEPHTEAGPEALLVNFLEAFGNAVGNGPHAIAEADRHGCNLNAVLVGETSKGRKGSSWGHVRELFRQVDADWTDNHILAGLSSGEGLIWAVRDPTEKTEAVKEKGKLTGENVTYESDPGISDKRLLVMEPEFASVLQVMRRDSNTLSAIIRQAWDSGTLRTLTKTNPAKATGAHISIVGHITRDELLRHLSATESANGFGNRILWLCARRARVLPEGGGQPSYGRLLEELRSALIRAKNMGLIERDEQSRAAWSEVYPDLSNGYPGLFGAITGRAEAQVLRLSVLYAALDGSQLIQIEHLEAALAVWQYCEASARYIFGDATGDPTADRIMEALANGEMDRTAIYYLFGKHVSSERIGQALAMLCSANLVRVERRESDGGRPREVWLLA